MNAATKYPPHERPEFQVSNNFTIKFNHGRYVLEITSCGQVNTAIIGHDETQILLRYIEDARLAISDHWMQTEDDYRKQCQKVEIDAINKQITALQQRRREIQALK